MCVRHSLSLQKTMLPEKAIVGAGATQGTLYLFEDHEGGAWGASGVGAHRSSIGPSSRA